LLERQRAARDEIRDVDQALNTLATRDETVQRARDAVNVQSYVRGRIALYLDSSDDTGDEELERLRREVATAEQLAASLAESLDGDAVRSRTTSLLRTVSRQMTNWAQALDLEHAEHGALIDIDELTVVADTPQGPAYMNAGGIGSGMNWVGYHLTAYLALQNFFIRKRRPVPSFIVLDQKDGRASRAAGACLGIAGRARSDLQVRALDGRQHDPLVRGRGARRSESGGRLGATVKARPHEIRSFKRPGLVVDRPPVRPRHLRQRSADDQQEHEADDLDATGKAQGRLVRRG
jgi:hypothetical protein